MAARASRASTPHASAATAAINALDWLKRPGSDSRTGALRPSAHSPRAVPSGRDHERRLRIGAGEATARAGPAALGERDATLAGGAAHGIVLPAQPGAHPVHVAGRPGPPHHERVVGVRHDVRVRCGRQRRPPAAGDHAHLVGAVELIARQVQEQHGRGRRGRRGRAAGRPRRSRGRRARAFVPASAATWPGGMFEPVSLLTTASPDAPSATVSSRVVVVFPLVPVTRATWRPALRCSSSRRSRRRPARPPATVPWPRPRRREVALTTRVVALASCGLTEGACCGPAPRGSARGAPSPRGAAAR